MKHVTVVGTVPGWLRVRLGGTRYTAIPHLQPGGKCPPPDNLIICSNVAMGAPLADLAQIRSHNPAVRVVPDGVPADRLVDLYLAGLRDVLPCWTALDLDGWMCTRGPVHVPSWLERPPAAGPVLDSLHYLASHRYNVSVKELGIGVGLSRSALQRRFIKVLEIPPGRVIRQVRQALRDFLLLAGVHPSDIASALGYRHAGSFRAAVRRETGECPTRRAETLKRSWTG